ncbi:hypothetical protein TrVGV298_000509 [Trichoderma virens]|nr:hypothetical protein TrVGV298_000509 [Trichoderma virens]
MLASATCASPPGDRVIRRSRLVAFSKTALLHTKRRTYSAYLLRFLRVLLLVLGPQFRLTNKHGPHPLPARQQLSQSAKLVASDADDIERSACEGGRLHGLLT